VDFVRQPRGQPPGRKRDATDEEKAAHKTAQASWEAALKQALEKLSPESLKNYDGVIFASTSGDLPIPDRQGFLSWIKAGHAFIGLHGASETFQGWPGYVDMLGGERMPRLDPTEEALPVGNRQIARRAGKNHAVIIFQRLG